MDAVMLQLTRARNRLTTPASMTLPELATSGLMVQDKRPHLNTKYHQFMPFSLCLPFVSLYQQKMFTPPMPGDVMVNFYINLSKLCLTVYQLHVLPPNTTKVRTRDSLKHLHVATHSIM